MTDDMTRVLGIVQLANGVVAFADSLDEGTKLDVLVTLPRKDWDALGNPTTLTVSMFAGGVLVDKAPEKNSQGLTFDLGGPPATIGGPYL